MTDRAFQQCINPACAATFGVNEVHVACAKCGSLLDIKYDWNRLPVPRSLAFFEHRWATKGTETEGKLDFSGVWRFREMMPFFRTESDIVTIGEGRTMLQTNDLLGKYVGMKPGTLQLQYEGLNPSGSFKDNGMTAAFTHAKMVGAKRVACASTGNTSASLAMFASMSDIQGVVFIGSGKIAFGKLSQALDYGALTHLLVSHLGAQSGFSVHYKHRVVGLARLTDGRWHVSVVERENGIIQEIQARFVFAGAGGGALDLLQRSHIPEGKGYGGFPVSGIWLRCDADAISR